MKLRLLPAVFVSATALLLLKGTDMTLEARAETAAPTADAPTPAATAAPASADPAADDAAPGTAGEVDVLTSLAKRRAALDSREQALDMRENLIHAAELRVEGKITQLKQLQGQVQVLLGARDDAEQKQLAALVKTYSSMKPQSAAHIFNTLNDDVLLAVASQMKPDVLGAILSGMQADAAQKLTVRLANKMKIPETPPAQQLAANTPPLTPPPAQGTAPAAAPIATAPAAPAPVAAANPPPAAAATSAPPPANSTAAPAKK